MIRGQSYKNLVAFVIDLFAGLCATGIGLYLRLGDSLFNYSKIFLIHHLVFFAISLIIAQLVYKVYKNIWRYFNLETIIKIAKFAGLSVLLFLLAQFFDTRLEKFPRSVIIIDWLLIILFVSTPRLLYRAYQENSFNNIFKNDKLITAIPLLIIGLDRSIVRFIQEMHSMGDSNYKIVGILDDKPHNVNRVLLNIPILGTLDDFKTIIEKLEKKKLKPSRILVSSEYTLSGKLQNLIALCEKFSISLFRLPQITALTNNLAKTLNPIPLEELLYRSQKKLDYKKIKKLGFNKIILITGAGGSIGAEIVKQIAETKPKKIFLLDSSEFLLYEIEQECKMRFPDLSIRASLIDIKDSYTLEKFFQKNRPQIIFHAAALKHVPLLEQHKINAIETNILGTVNLVDLAIKYSCSEFIMISTDKAVDPLSFMGVTKRIAEMYCQVNSSSLTKINIVRFGNVLGSNGSVVPLFEKQIAFGGPITITHPDVTRFFMTIKEAVGLVLQAATLKNNDKKNKVYVLDMGNPIKIVDLARKMINLAGLKPDVDIRIEFVGLRPGEKLHEILVTEHEALSKTDSASIFLASPKVAKSQELYDLINNLKASINARDEFTAVKLINDFIKVQL